MASIGNDPGGRRRILFVDTDGKRPTIRLGKMSKRQAEAIKVRVELLLVAKISRTATDDETSRWVAGLDDVLQGRLAAVGLITSRCSAVLGEFVRDYIAKREGVVETSTLQIDKQTESLLINFFGENKPLRDISEGDAEDFRNDMIVKDYAEATIRKRCSIAGKMMRYAKKHRLVNSNPFSVVPTNSIATEHLAYIETAKAIMVLDEMPGTQYKLLFAMSRWGGLRIGSEVRQMVWSDVDWARRRMTIHSPKTKRHAGHAEREIPIFPEIAELLSLRFQEAEEGEEMILPVLRGITDTALRNTLMRVIRRVGLEVWARPWHNMRMTRQVELEKEGNPSFVVCKWLGNNEATAIKHYLRVVPDEFFERAIGPTGKAAQNPAQHLHESPRTEPQDDKPTNAKTPVLQGLAGECDIVYKCLVVREGLEPPTKGL
jgi:integrase